MFIILISIVIILFFIFMLKNATYTVPSNYAYVIERNGHYHLTAEVGHHNKNPFSDKIVCKCSLLESNIDIIKQPIITKDNQTLLIEGYVLYKINNPQLFKYSADNVPMALSLLTVTTLRNLLGEHDCDDVCNGNADICDCAIGIIQSTSAQWGISVLSITYTISN